MAAAPAHVARLLDPLGVEVPVLQSGMGGVAGPELVAAVCEAGGLGILAALRMPPDLLRVSIAHVRRQTDRPFGVNIWLHDEVRTPPDPGSVDPAAVHAVQDVFNPLRQRLGLPERDEAPPAGGPQVDDMLEIMIEERIPVFSAGVGIPEEELVSRFHEVGTKVVSMVADVADAQTAVAAGCDVIVAQGSEAGGHRSHGTKPSPAAAAGIGTIALIPAIVDVLAPDVPVVGAGGLAEGRGLAAVIALGAGGVLMGTRFVATRESEASEVWKQRLMGRQNETTVTDGFTGQWARTLRSEFTDHWAKAGVDSLPGLLQAAMAGDIYAAAREAEDDQLQPLFAGESVELITDLPSASEVVVRTVSQAEAILDRSLRAARRRRHPVPPVG